jgi:hypothetical protein
MLMGLAYRPYGFQGACGSAFPPAPLQFAPAVVLTVETAFRQHGVDGGVATFLIRHFALAALLPLLPIRNFRHAVGKFRCRRILRLASFRACVALLRGFRGVGLISLGSVYAVAAPASASAVPQCAS